MPTIKNLVFEGGGVLGVAYAGALDALSQYTDLSLVRGIAGSSAGAITAFLFSLNYRPQYLMQSARELPYAKLAPALPLPYLTYRLIFKRGLFSLRPLQRWLEDQSQEQLGIRRLTFQELHWAKGLTLKIYATQVATGEVIEFSPTKTPNFPISQAVLHSATVPNLFIPTRYNGHYLSDGGVTLNYPIRAFDATMANTAPSCDASAQTLGLKVDGEPRLTPRRDNLIAYNLQHLEMIYEQVNQKHIRQKDFERTVRINTGRLAAFNFQINHEQIEELMQRGHRAMEAYACAKGWPRWYADSSLRRSA